MKHHFTHPRLFALFLTFGVTTTQAEVTIQAVPLTDNLHMLTGRGGNMGVFTGKDGTFLIDDQFAPLSQKILTAISDLGGTTPKFLINTHYHGDHSGGNENFGKLGTLILSHDNVRRQLASGSFIQAFNKKRSPLEKGALPVLTFSTDITLHLNGDTLHVFHLPDAHTNGDSAIHFKQANVIHTGDIFFNGTFPFIDVDHGGSLKGMIAAVSRLLALTNNQTKIIPGHGPLSNQSQLQAYHSMLSTAFKRLSQLKHSGVTAEEAIKQKPLADLDSRWGKGHFTTDDWIKLIYPGVY